MKLRTTVVVGSLCLAGVVSAQVLPLPEKPRIGLRVSAGQWNRTMIGAGLDITVKIPFVPIPALRFDAELWGNPSDFGGGKRGNAISVMGIKNFPLIYAGLGPTFYFTSDGGDHNSGLGAKLLVGADIPGNYYIEGSVIVGPRPVAVFVSLGFKF